MDVRSVRNVLRQLHADPAAPQAGDFTERLLDNLAQARRPTDETMLTIARNAYLLMGLGYGERTRALIRDWRRGGAVQRELAFADAFLALSSAPRAAARELVELLTRSSDGAVLAVAGLFAVGDLEGCVALARRYRFFVGRPAHVYGAAYAAHACALLGDLGGAERVLRRWRAKRVLPASAGARTSNGARTVARAHAVILRAEAWVADARQRHTIAETYVEEAIDLCRAPDLGVERTFLEAELVIYRARRGDLDGARTGTRGWTTRASAQPSVFQAHRDMARMEIALASESWRAAERHGQRALRAWQHMKNEVLTLQLRFGLALTAPPEEFASAVKSYAVAVMRAPVPHHVGRLRVLERCIGDGMATATELTLAERTRFSRERVPLLRLWLPRAGLLSADIYADRVQQHVYLRGDGPCSLADRPVLAALLDALLDADGFALPLDALFRRVWGGSYRPLVHESKVRVTLHRLRAWLDRGTRHGGRIVEMKNGVVSLAATAEIRVLEHADAHVARTSRPSLEDRVWEALASGSSSCDAIGRRTSASRSSVLAVLRTLVHQRKVTRTGRGPVTRYHVT
jgi:hypothetical protein